MSDRFRPESVEEETLSQISESGETHPRQVGRASPTRIAHYRIERPLGRGGMGEVFLALDTRLGRRVALKKITVGKRNAAGTRARFWREARALAALGRSEGLVEVYEFGETDQGELYLAMELIEGVALSEVMAGTWPLWAVRSLLVGLVRALATVHGAGMTHRDVKPANIMLTQEGEPRLVDFGLARRMDRAEEQVTDTGAVVGTLAYMSPEQYRGEGVGPSSDVFSVGVLAYRLLAGRHPFSRETMQATAIASASGTFTPLGEVLPSLPAPWIDLVARAMAFEPKDRFDEGQDLLEALLATPEPAESVSLGTWLAGQRSTLATQSRPDPAPTPRRNKRPFVASVAVVLGVVAAGFLVWGPLQEAEAPPEKTAAPETISSVSWGTRPTFWIRDLRGEGAAEGVAKIASDALRLHLEDDPTLALVVPSGGMSPHLRERLKRDEDDIGWLFSHGPEGASVDFLIDGQVSQVGESHAVTLRIRHTREGTAWAAKIIKSPVEAGGTGLGARIAGVLLETIGATEGGRPEVPWTRSDEAYRAYMDARDLYLLGDRDGGQARLDAALRYDPGFGLVHAEKLLRGLEGTGAQFAEKRLGLLGDGQPLPMRLVARLDAWESFHGKSSDEASKQMYRVLERWPYALDTYDDLTAWRFHNPLYLSMAEVERLCRLALRAAPHQKTFISRLIRSMSWRGRWDGLSQALEEAKVPLDTAPGLNTIRAERDLYLKRYQSAIEGFSRSVDQGLDESYAYHMRIVARILDGQCSEALTEAHERIALNRSRSDRVAQLEWTYHLAVQALFCWGKWAGAEKMLLQWKEDLPDSNSPFHAYTLHLPSLRLALGASPKAVEAELMARLEEVEGDDIKAHNRRASAMVGLCRVSTQVDSLARWAKAQDDFITMHAEPHPVMATQRRALAYRCRSRAMLVQGQQEEALERYKKAVVRQQDIRSEADLSTRTDSLVYLAEALEYAGRREAALDIWRQIPQMGYTRLWRTSHWTLARKKLSVP